MHIYVVSLPTDNKLILTANRDAMMAGRKAVKDAGGTVEVWTWDTEKSAICSINLNFELPTEDLPVEREAGIPSEPGAPMNGLPTILKDFN